MDFSEYQTEIIEDIKSCLEGLQVQPILFMGAGVSQRYLKAPDWENLLKYLAETCPLITRPYGYYSQTRNDNKPMIASDFSESYAEWAWDVGTSRYPEQYFNGKSSKDIYIKHEIATLLNNLSDSVDFSAMEYTEEIEKLKKVRPHAIITTNYDDLLEKIHRELHQCLAFLQQVQKHLSKLLHLRHSAYRYSSVLTYLCQSSLHSY